MYMHRITVEQCLYDGQGYYCRLVGVTQYLVWGGLSETGSRSPTPNAYGLNVQVDEQVCYCLAVYANGLDG